MIRRGFKLEELLDSVPKDKGAFFLRKIMKISFIVPFDHAAGYLEKSFMTICHVHEQRDIRLQSPAGVISTYFTRYYFSKHSNVSPC